jgi:ATP-dependent DNA helicase RecG
LTEQELHSALKLGEEKDWEFKSERGGVPGSLWGIRVPKADRRHCPVYVEQNPFTGTYRRIYEGDYHCSGDEVGRMLADQAEEPADSQILEHFGIDDLDPSSLQQFRQRFSARDPTHPWLSLDHRGLLAKSGA